MWNRKEVDVDNRLSNSSLREVTVPTVVCLKSTLCNCELACDGIITYDEFLNFLFIVRLKYVILYDLSRNYLDAGLWELKRL